jgi:hypothetical protein
VICVHPDPEYQLQTAALPLKVDREELYLVAPELWPELSGELRAIIFFTAINRDGVVFLWPVKLPGEDGRHDTWNASALDGAEAAKQQWVRVASNTSLGAYDVFTTESTFSAPAWPQLTLRELLRTAFRDRFIEDINHPVLKRLRGEF